MSRHIVPIKKDGDPSGQSLFQTIENALQTIRDRAFELFRARGDSPRNDLDDWFRAERELFEVPDGELTETSDGFQVTIAAKGFHADRLGVAVDDSTVTIHGATYAGDSGKGFFRRFTLPEKIDAGKVRANLSGGSLKVTLPRMTEAQPSEQPVEHRAAA